MILKIDYKEIEELIKKKYKLKNVCLIKTGTFEPDYEICEYPADIEGEVEL